MSALEPRTMVDYVSRGDSPIGSNDDCVYSFVLHRRCGHTVAQKSSWNVIMDQLIGGQSGALADGSRFHAIHMLESIAFVQRSNHAWNDNNPVIKLTFDLLADDKVVLPSAVP